MVTGSVATSAWNLPVARISRLRYRTPGSLECDAYGIPFEPYERRRRAQLGRLARHRTRRRRAEADLRTTFERIREMGRRLLSVQETERTRIARELHDDISQQLAWLKIDLATGRENVPTTLVPDLTLCLFRIVQEAIQNALKHGHAENVSVHLSGGSDSLSLTVIVLLSR